MALTYEELYGIQEKSKKKKKKKDDDIAPVHSSTSKLAKPLATKVPTVSSTYDLLKTYSPSPVAPTVTTSKKKKDDDRTWFQKGSDDISKKILGSVTDIAENLGTGIIGMGEKITDSLAMMGTAMSNAQMSQLSNDELAFSALKNIGKDKKTKEKEAENIVKKYDTAKKEAIKGTSEFVKKDMYDEEKIAKKIISAPVKNLTGIDAETDSIFGEKSDALVQSGGQLLATAGLQAVGVPWFLTTGLTSYGAEAENALNQGATFEQASISATISAGAEILTEKLSGGIKFGGKTLDDVLLKPLTEKITSKVLKSLANLGIDALGEGSEEVVSGILSNLGTALYKEESIGELLTSEEAVDEYIESFIGGAVLGGAGSVVQTVANRNRIELTENEQKVVDKVVEDRIAEATEENDGKAISKRKEKEIRQAVIRDLEKGYIDIDTIESVLGGEEYENYKKSKDKSDETIAKGKELIETLEKSIVELQQEYDELNKVSLTEATLGDKNRQAQIEKKQTEIQETIEKNRAILEGLENDTRLSDLKTKLGQNVFDLVKDSRLSESYKEIDRHKQVFSADPEQYENEYAKKTIQNALDYRNDEGYGIDNTNASHDFIDLMTKYATDREVEIVFTTTKGLAELKKNGNKYGIKADPNKINAFVSKEHKKMFLNMDTGKNLYSLVGHEVTHTVVNAKSLGKLNDVVKAYLGEAEYKKIYDKKAETYKGLNLKKAEIEEEIVADFCGEKLLTDYDFVMHLATNEQNIFQKAWDSIKYLYKMATAGSKEARQLEKAKRIFEKAYRESAKNIDAGVKHSLSEDDLYSRAYEMRIEVNKLTKSISEFEKSDDFKSQMKKLSDAIANDDVENGIKAYQQWQKESGYEALIDKRDALKAELDSINKKAQEDYLNKEIEKEKAAIAKSGLSEADYFRKQAVKEFGYTPYFYDAGYITPNGKMLNFSGEKGKHYGGRGQDHRGIGTIYAETTGTDALNRFVRDGNIRIMAEAPGIDMSTVAEPTKEQYSTIRKFVYEYSDKGFFSVDFTDENGKVIGSLQYENRINPTRILNDIKHFYATGEIREQSSIEKLRYSLSPEQESYFKDSKVRDENGNLKVMYHGTSKGGHTVFDTYGSNYGLMGTGSYFTDNKEVADSYTKKGRGENPQVYEAYLNITNPLDMDAQANPEEWKKAFDFDDIDFPESGTNEQFFRAVEEYYYEEMMPKWEVAEEIRESIQFGMGYDGITHIGGGRFNKNDDTRHQVYIAFEPEQIKNIDNIAPTKDADIRYSLSEGQEDYFKESKIRDESGNLKVMYHGSHETFTVFDKKKARSSGTYGKGFYFTDSKSHAGTYGDSYEVYLNITNPLQNGTNDITKDQLRKFVKAVAEDEDYGIENYGYGATIDSVTDSIYGKTDFGMLLDLNVSCIGNMVEAVELFNKVNGTDYDGIVAPTETVAFYPNQIKSVTNENPTDNPDIRFSLSENVEETRDLMALHNLHSNELMKQLKMGGIAYPSVAVTKPETLSHEGFGDITLILNKDAIDPKKSKYNKLYSADAYTPTFPNVNYEASRDVAENIADKVKSLYDAIPEDYKRSLTAFRDYTNIDERLNSARGEEGLIERYLDDYSFKQLYLADKGEVVPTEIKRTEKQITEYQREQYQFVVDRLGAELLESSKPIDSYTPPLTARLQWFEQYGDDLKDAYAEYWSDDGKMTKEEALEIANSESAGYWARQIKAITDYIKTGGITVKEEADIPSTNALIDEKINVAEYKEWLTNLFNGIEGSSGIRNSKDLFTPSGKRRSFSQLHDPVTIDNVIKVMRKQGQTGQGAFGTGNIQGASAQEFGSIAVMKENSDRLGVMDEAEHEEITQQINDRIFEIAKRYSNGKDLMDAQTTIVEAVSKYETKEGIARYLKQFDYVYKYTDSIGDDIIELRDYIRSLPTPYFEAKPQRAVSFNEVAVFVIPRDADIKVKQELLNKGYSIAEYDPKIEGDRQRVVNSFEEYKFSLSDAGETFGDSGNLKVYAKDIMTPTDIAPVSTVSKMERVEDVAPTMTEAVVSAPTNTDESLKETPIITTKQKISAKLKQSQAELEKNIQLREKSNAYYDEKIAKAQAEYDAKKNKDSKAANNLLRSIERYKRLKGSADADYKKRINDIESRVMKLDDQLLKNHDKADRLERYKKRADARLKADKEVLKEEFEQRRAELQEEIADKNTFVRNKALALYNELNGLKKGIKASEELGFFLDEGFNWSELKSTFLKVSKWSDVVLNPESEVESIVREAIGRDYEDKVAYGMDDLDAEYNKQVEQLEADAQKKLDGFKVANQRMTKQQEYTNQMEALVGDTSTWKDKKLGISYEVNTLRRNLRDIVRDANGNKDIAKADAITDELQGKYNHNEAELNREETKIKQPYAEKKITKAEDTYIQMLGELRHNPETTLTEDVVKEFYEKHKKHIDEAKVDEIIEDARTMYDNLFVRVNQALAEQGMKEIPYRKGYFPHFTEDKQGFLGKLFNWKTQNNEIPTSIAGLTEMFEPNRSWQSFNKQRKTDVTDYSFTKGLDNYVHGALDWIYHIEDIQKRRAFENHIRYIHSEEGIKAKVDAIRQNEKYDADEMQEQIDLVYREANNPLNNFIQDFHTATNSLAGKKSTFDRDLEQRTNRKVYSVMTNLSNRVSGNMVAGSVSSALTNFIPITQSWVEVSPVNSLRAMGETIKSTIRDDGTVDKSDFLTNRLKKAENLYQTNWDKIGKGVGILMDVIDNFTAQTVWRSKYIQNMSKGMSESQAIKNADQFAANVMADRSRGNQPTLFDSKSPVAKVFTAFQLEVNNQYGYFFKDAPQDIANKSKARLIGGYATAFIGAYAYNALYSAMTGRDAAFDPIGIIEDLMRDLGFGDDDDEEEEIAPVNVVKNFSKNILEEVPFVGGLLGGGRIPISSAMPYGGIMEAWEGTLQDISEKNLKSLTKEWLNPVYYLALPMGGGQIRKTNQGLAMFSDDHPVTGSYTDSGNLRFPVEKTPGNVLQSAVFGQYANKNARTYFDEGYAPLKEKQIQEYKDADMPIADYWKYREGLKDFDKQDEKAAYINGLDISNKQKNVLKSYLYDEEGYKEENPEKYAFLEREGIGYIGYKEADEDTQSAWSWAFKHQDEYEYYKENGVYPGDYSTYYIPMLDFEDEDNDAYSWAFNNPEKATFSKAITDNVVDYRKITSGLYEIRADKDRNGKAINGSAKKKKKAYIWGLDIDEEAKYILFKNEYPSFDDKNREIVEYLINRDDLSYDEVNDICEQLGYKVNRDTGDISWD